jgi:thiopeptide-type bacteriocin biosynthesis protein
MTGMGSMTSSSTGVSFHRDTHIGSQRIPLKAFLLYCADSLGGPAHPALEPSEELMRLRDHFLRAGVRAVTDNDRTTRWIQLGVRPAVGSTAHRELSARIKCVVERLLAESGIENFFFMHKAPGLRLRFEAAAECRSEVRDLLSREIAQWRSDGIVEAFQPGMYEPESELFGGARSMQYVHALFTIDAIAWLEYHAADMEERDRIGTRWMHSLSMLRDVFDGLGILGWEDIGVWELVGRRLGRGLHAEVIRSREFEELAADVGAAWVRLDQTSEDLPAAATLSAYHRESLRAAAEQWRTGYFETDRAVIGPRAAAALYVIFHWNRGAMSAPHQALLTEALTRSRGLHDERL